MFRNQIRHILALLLLGSLPAHAQIGEHRSDFAVGVNGGYMLSKVGFTPDVSQGYHGGITGGFSLRYVCEKYFKTICSIYAEVNYAQAGWKENILDVNDQPVVITETGEALAYKRTINYVQIPVFAHLAWGRETKGVNFFVNAGPQFGFYLSDKQTSNFQIAKSGSYYVMTRPDGSSITVADDNARVNNVVAQDTMAIEKKFDYGIAVGAGIEYSHPKIGHFLLEGRYYYGLGNIYGSSKRDYFGKSNYGQIVVKLSYLFDIARTREVKRK